MSATVPSILDVLRQYTALRGLAVALLFVLSALVKIPAVLAVVAVHLLERTAARLLSWANQIPPQPKPTARAGGSDR